MFRRHILYFVAVVAAFTLLASACRREDNTVPDPEQQDRIIATATLTDDPSKVAVTWFPAPCESFDEVLVELDDEFANLRIRVTVDVADCPAAGATETVVDLGEPLGNRQIWDKAFGNSVALG